MASYNLNGLMGIFSLDPCSNASCKAHTVLPRYMRGTCYSHLPRVLLLISTVLDKEQ